MTDGSSERDIWVCYPSQLHKHNAIAMVHMIAQQQNSISVEQGGSAAHVARQIVYDTSVVRLLGNSFVIRVWRKR